MAINIDNPEVDALLRQLAERTGESMTETVLNALRERLDRLGAAGRSGRRAELAAIRRRCAKLPVLDARSPEDLLGYDDAGLPR